MATPELRLTPILTHSDAPYSREISVQTPEGEGRIPISGQPSLPATGANLGGRFTLLTPSPWLSINIAGGVAASFGVLTSYSANFTAGAKLHLPNSYAAITADAGASLWTVSTFNSNFRALGALVAMGVEVPITDRLSAAVGLGLATDGTVSQTTTSLGVSYAFGARPLPPTQIPSNNFDGWIALERARAQSKNIESLSTVILDKIRVQLKNNSGNLDAQLTTLIKFIEWFNFESRGQNDLGLPIFYNADYRIYAKAVLHSSDSSQRVSDLVQEITTINRRALARFTNVGVSFITTGDDSLYEVLLKVARAANPSAPTSIKQYEACINKMGSVLDAILNDDSLKGYLSEADISKLTEIKAKTACLKTGIGCGAFKLEASLALPNLKPR